MVSAQIAKDHGCSHNLMSQKKCWIAKKKKKNLDKYLFIPFKAMAIMAS
jgi:hypothetical protein